MIPTELYVKLAPMVAHHAFLTKMTLLSSKQLIMAILLTLTQIPATWHAQDLNIMMLLLVTASTVLMVVPHARPVMDSLKYCHPNLASKLTHSTTSAIELVVELSTTTLIPDNAFHALKIAWPAHWELMVFWLFWLPPEDTPLTNPHYSATQAAKLINITTHSESYAQFFSIKAWISSNSKQFQILNYIFYTNIHNYTR